MNRKSVIHVVEDEAPVRTSIAFLLINEGYPVCVYDAGEAFLEVADNSGNAVLLTDLRMPGMNGIELLQAMQRLGIRMPAVVLTGHGDISSAVAAMKAGAVDFLEKPFDDDTLIAAIERAAAHASTVNTAEAAGIFVRERLESLTQREREVLSGIIDGKSNKVIAFDLKISPRTVEIHRAGLMAKLHLKNIPDLFRTVLPLTAEIPWLSTASHSLPAGSAGPKVSR